MSAWSIVPRSHRVLQGLPTLSDSSQVSQLSYSPSWGRSRRCNFAPCDKGQCPHGALFHAVPECCKCFQRCRITGTAKVGTRGSYPTLLEALGTPWDSVEQSSMVTLSLVQRNKVASSDPTFRRWKAQSLKGRLDWDSQKVFYATLEATQTRRTDLWVFTLLLSESRLFCVFLFLMMGTWRRILLWTVIELRIDLQLVSFMN